MDVWVGGWQANEQGCEAVPVPLPILLYFSSRARPLEGDIGQETESCFPLFLGWEKRIVAVHLNQKERVEFT
jgi:hypothetical protein